MKTLCVLCNMPNPEIAQQIAQTLVQESLAACVNLLAPCHSTYIWEQQLEISQEWPLLIKTTENQYAALETRLTTLHPYETPEIIAWPISHGLPAYLNWVREQTQP